MSRQTMSNESPTAAEQAAWTQDTDRPMWPQGTESDTAALRMIAHNLACLVDSVDTLRASMELEVLGG